MLTGNLRFRYSWMQVFKRHLEALYLSGSDGLCIFSLGDLILSCCSQALCIGRQENQCPSYFTTSVQVKTLRKQIALCQ